MEKVLQKWLDHQCRMLQGCGRALLVTGKPRKGKFKRSFFWPDDNYNYAVFYRVAQVAVRNKKTVIKTLRNQGKDSDQSLNVLACPIFLKRKLLGAIVIAMAYRSLSLQNAAVQQVQNGVKWLEAMLELPYDPLQAAKSKLFGLRRPSLQMAAGLAVILLVGLVLISPLLRIPSDSKTEEVTRRTVVTPQKIDVASNQIRLDVKPDKGDAATMAADQNLQLKDQLQDKEPDVASGESQVVQEAASPEASQEQTPSTSAPEVKDEDSTASTDSDIAKTPSEVVAQTHSIQIGPILKASKLKQATQVLQKNGFEYQQTTGEGSVKAIRLLEGLYTRSKVKERFKAVQKLVPSPFVLREKGGMAIYVATYYDRARAEQKIKQLAKKNIQVTAVDIELKKKGSMLTIPNSTPSHIDIITNQMSEIGLSVEIKKSE
jgi:hypothetical protein